MMHQTIAILQEQHEEQLLLHPQHQTTAMQQQQRHDKSVPEHFDPQQQSSQITTSSSSTEQTLSQRLWRFVRESVLTQPRRKVRSASYSPQGSAAHEERPRESKRRARSCGHAAEQPRRPGSHCSHHHRNDNNNRSSAARASATIANAWRKSKMLQELEASTERGRSCCVPTTVVVRDQLLACHNAQQQQRLPLPAPRHSARRTCSNCERPYFMPPAFEREDMTSAFCSLDCRSSFEYLAAMQRLVDVRIDEHGSSDEMDATCGATL